MVRGGVRGFLSKPSLGLRVGSPFSDESAGQFSCSGFRISLGPSVQGSIRV